MAPLEHPLDNALLSIITFLTQAFTLILLPFSSVASIPPLTYISLLKSILFPLDLSIQSDVSLLTHKLIISYLTLLAQSSLPLSWSLLLYKPP